MMDVKFRIRFVWLWRKVAEVGKRRIALLQTHETCEANVQNFVLGPGTGPSPSGPLLLFRAHCSHPAGLPNFPEADKAFRVGTGRANSISNLLFRRRRDTM